MKRFVAITLALILTMSLVACGSPSDGEMKEPANVATGNGTDTQQSGQKAEATINEMVLVDNAGVKITAKSLSTSGLLGPEIKLLIENNSGKDLTFQCRNASVNGYMVETTMSVDVANGKKANDSITFMRSDLDACGIAAIADIELAFHIFDMAQWETYLDTDAVQIKTSIADGFEYSYDDSGNLVHDGNGVKIVVKGLSTDGSILGPSLVVYIENSGDKDVTVQVRDVSVNGFMVSTLFSCDVVAGKRAVDTITFMKSDLEENEIAAIEDIALYFHIFDMAEWDTIVDTDIIELTF